MSTVAHSTSVPLKSILVATDFSPASEKPLRHGLAIAHRYGTKFFLAHVVSSLGLNMAGPDAIFAAEAAASRDAHNLEEHLRTTGAFGHLEHHVIVRQGEVWKQLEIIIRQEHVDLVVLGTHGRHGFGKLVLGSVAEQIFRNADCPVLTVGPGCYDQPRVDPLRANRKFLFATDFGAASVQALPYGISFANQFDAQLVLFHALSPVLMPEDFRTYSSTDVAQMQEDARCSAHGRLARLVADAQWAVHPELVVEPESLNSPSEDILEMAQKLKVDLIIMGLHRSSHTESASHTPWTTAYEVVCGAGCPVLTVRSGIPLFVPQASGVITS
jgi:nucleotide-binding universal stress UspA family protein